MTEPNKHPFLMTPEEITALLNDRTVEGRNRLQQSGLVHPYTCRNDKCRTATNQAPLRAIEGGWICDYCGYTQ